MGWATSAPPLNVLNGRVRGRIGVQGVLELVGKCQRVRLVRNVSNGGIFATGVGLTAVMDFRKE